MVEVALFPIPNSVNFPGVPCPLHVFEPRYRQMVRHCVDNAMLMGVCHTEKLLHTNSREQSVREALNSNQSTYKPQGIFSAGQVSILQELDDGRMLIQVDTAVRLRLVEERQTLPFGIWACDEVLDEPLDAEAEGQLAQTQAKILQRLLAVLHDNEQAREMLQGEYWQAMPALDFSFAIAGILGMAPETSQSLLEMTSPQQRLDTVLELLNGLGPAVGG
ncbi:MAG: LON peptidase substrate-binding domain-containing protein [Halioglobus sp.]